MNARRLLTSALLAIGLAGGFVHASDEPNPASTPGPGEPTLAEVRRLTERFRDVNVALAEGYIRDPFDMCETAEMMGRPAALGAMGIHFFRPDLLGITRPPSPRVSWHRDAHGLSATEHSDLRAQGRRIARARRRGEPGVCRRVARGRTHRTADVPWRAVRCDGRRPEHGARRGAHVRAALRPACLDLSREPERRVHAAESGGDVRGPPGRQDSFSSWRLALNTGAASTSEPPSPRTVLQGTRATDCRAEACAQIQPLMASTVIP